MWKAYLVRSDLGQALARALEAHRARYGQPAAVVVNRVLLDEARAVLASQWPSLPVRSSCGCLAWELWLELPAQEAASETE